MGPPALLAVLLWLQGVLAVEDACHSLGGSRDLEGQGPPPSVSVSNQRTPTSLFVNWTAAEPGGLGHALCLLRLSPLGSPEGQPLQVHTKASSFEFHNLVPGSRYQLQVTVSRPCGKNATVTLTTRTAPSTVQELQLHSPGSPTGLEASWGEAPGERDGYQLLLYHQESQTLAQNISVSPGNLSYRFDNLSPGSQYVLEVITWAGDLQAKTSVRQWTDPMPPDYLMLSALGTSALHASWNRSEGAARLHLVLTDHLGSSNLTAVVSRGVSNHTFLHLTPGTRYELRLSAAAGPHWATGPNATEWTYPSPPLDLVLTPVPPELQASWKAGPGAWDGYLLRLSGPVERNISLGPEVHSAMIPGPLPTGHYALELRVLAGLHHAYAQASAWLADPAAQPRQGSGAKLQLQGLKATREPGRRALLYADGAPGLLGNISVPSGATQVTFYELVPGARYRVDIASFSGVITQSLAGHTSPLAPRSLEVISREHPSELTIGWASAPGQREGYKVAWHQDGSQRSPNSLVDAGPDHSRLTLRDLVPGSCYTVSVWAWAGDLHSSIQRMQACTRPAPVTNLSLSVASEPPALRASWSPPPGGRDGFRLRIYNLRSLALEKEETLVPEARNFSWAQLAPGSEFLVQLGTLRGLDESSSANATVWTPPLAPPEIRVTSEGPTQLRASWGHASGGRDRYQLTLFQEGTPVATSSVGPEADSTSFSALTPGTKYEVELAAQAGLLRTAAANVSGWTPPRVPSELLVSVQAGSAVVSLAWASGPLGRGTCRVQLSEDGHPIREEALALGQAHLVLRGLTPGCSLGLSVLCQAGPLRASTRPVVLPVEPGPVEDVQCRAETTRLALRWSMPPGHVGTCLVVAERLEAGGGAHLVLQANTSQDAFLLPDLAPATPYRLSLTVLGRNGLWSRAVSLVCSTSAQAWRPPELAAAPRLELEAGLGVTITRGMFGKDDGQIQWYGVLATNNMSLPQPPREAFNHTWFDHYYGGQDCYLAILLPNPFFPAPWAAPTTSWMVPMGTEDCGRTREICNGPLKLGFQYRFSVAAFTRLGSPETIVSFSAFSEPRASVSSAAVPLAGVVGTAAGVVLTAGAVMGLLCWWRQKGQGAEKDGFSHELTPHSLRWTHRPIPAHSFRQSYEAKSAHANQAFFQEFEELKEVGREQSRLEAERPANAWKNRYPHVLPYDHSRVRLTPLAGDPHSDYINASFIPGYAHPQEFIATQGPLKKTLVDFWRLVWEQQVPIIVMLTVGMENGRVLCEHYWPADPTPVTLGHLTIHLLAEEREEEWTVREFQLRHGAQRRQQRVKQLQFTTWPDHSTPEAPSSLLAFVQLVRELARAAPARGPILVHCSAGVGRTGTFIALLRLLRQLEDEQTVDVFNTVYTLRLHRPFMIQTPSQYIFLHSCLLNEILHEPSGTLSPSPRSGPISVTNFAQACAKRAANANSGFLKEYELLLQAIKDDTGSWAPPPGHAQDSSVCYDGAQAQLSLERESPTEVVTEAWLFPGGPSGRDHVVLTGPAGPEELWELVWEHGAHVLVSLYPLDTQEKPQEFWPTEMQPVVTDTVTVHRMAESNIVGWPCTVFRVTHGASGAERQVQHLQFQFWESGHELPAATLLPFLAAVGHCCSQGKSRKPGTLLSHASKGTAHLGIFLAMEQLLQQAGSECTVDVFNVALQQSQACGLMTPTLEQYIYLYNCLNSALVDGLP
ncbi:receptor-type tyrosine-protein phosphatase V-like [Perognathus longimembris pacificus]|uniref:receptor-type tyrosine-protein phosphatase V-like n=1 Tax=Perognathus longimembris pacificus TaxID=214514 RepID=UPI00201A12C6|nr:receptor-type tyrosine-protein phosphatase V-like [Perognathus longimembris pacificus]